MNCYEADGTGFQIREGSRVRNPISSSGPNHSACRVVRALDLKARGRRFKSRSDRYKLELFPGRP